MQSPEGEGVVLRVPAPTEVAQYEAARVGMAMERLAEDPDALLFIGEMCKGLARGELHLAHGVWTPKGIAMGVRFMNAGILGADAHHELNITQAGRAWVRAHRDAIAVAYPASRPWSAPAWVYE